MDFRSLLTHSLENDASENAWSKPSARKCGVEAIKTFKFTRTESFWKASVVNGQAKKKLQIVSIFRHWHRLCCVLAENYFSSAFVYSKIERRGRLLNLYRSPIVSWSTSSFTHLAIKLVKLSGLGSCSGLRLRRIEKIFLKNCARCSNSTANLLWLFEKLEISQVETDNSASHDEKTSFQPSEKKFFSFAKKSQHKKKVFLDHHLPFSPRRLAQVETQRNKQRAQEKLPFGVAEP